MKPQNDFANRILCIDEDLSFLAALRAGLEIYGFQVEAASDTAYALDLCRSSPDGLAAIVAAAEMREKKGWNWFVLCERLVLKDASLLSRAVSVPENCEPTKIFPSAVFSKSLLKRACLRPCFGPPFRRQMLSELDLVVLTEPVPEHRLEKGDVGTVVQVLEPGKAFEVEFVTFKGVTVAVVRLEASQIRLLPEGAVMAANHEYALAA